MNDLLKKAGIELPVQGENRETVTSKKELTAADRKKKNDYQNRKRVGDLAIWAEQRKKIDLLDEDEISEYIKDTMIGFSDARIGYITIKVNPHEYALIRLALMKTGYRSFRELFVRMCAKTINVFGMKNTD